MSYSDWEQIDFSDYHELYYIACTRYKKEWSEGIKKEIVKIGEKCKKSLGLTSSQSVTHKELYKYIDENDLLKDFPDR
ncbi:hypothetical protein [Fusobacterium varium]